MEAVFRGMGTATALRSPVPAADAPDVACIYAASHHPCPTSPLFRVAGWRYAAHTRHCGGDPMIDWTDELMAQIGTFSRAALSYTGLDGYPFAPPFPFTFDAVEHPFTLPQPAHRPAISQSGH